MLYEIAHYIQSNMPWLWDIVECGNSAVFSLRYNKKLKDLPDVLKKNKNRFSFSMATSEDVSALANFFTNQPEEAFKFFHPHEFDEMTLRKLINRRSFLMFLVRDNEEIVGYFFLRCYANGNAFRGRMVDINRQNQGVGKQMGIVMNEIVKHIGLRMFSSISPDNYSSLASVKSVTDIKIIRTLENGYYYIECIPKDITCEDEKI